MIEKANISANVSFRSSNTQTHLLCWLLSRFVPVIFYF